MRFPLLRLGRIVGAGCLLLAIARAESTPPPLRHQPTLRSDTIQLTSQVGRETNPHLSPDGAQIAINGEYDGDVMAPRRAIDGLHGQWEVENVGVPSDIEAEFKPNAWREGHNPQLAKAVESALDELKRHPTTPAPLPSFPNYHQKIGL